MNESNLNEIWYYSMKTNSIDNTVLSLVVLARKIKKGILIWTTYCKSNSKLWMLVYVPVVPTVGLDTIITYKPFLLFLKRPKSRETRRKTEGRREIR